MDYDHIQFDLKNAPSLKLLRSEHAPLIISFLYRQFKQSHRVTILYTQLVEKLEDYLELLKESHPELYPRSAQSYLETWCDEDHPFLRKYYDNGDDPVFELTPGTEKVISWLEELNKSEFVGTESRFLRIFALLEEMVTKSTEDVTARLTQLEKQKEAIQQEIEAIKQTGQVERYNPTQIKERFIEANDLARRLLADFREVEQNFRDITRSVQEQELKEGTRKGTVVAYVIDADDTLKASDQGRSFYAFWDFLMAPSKQEELRSLLDTVYSLPELQTVTEENLLVLRRIKTSLIDAGEKIIQSNQRLAEQLRKMLDEKNLLESRSVRELITDIKRMAVTVVDNPPTARDFILLEGRPEVRLVMERPPWSPPETLDFSSQALSLGCEDLSSADLTGLYNQFFVDETTLKQQIDSMLARHHRITLAELTQYYPIQKGLAEIVAYFTIATQNEKHLINDRVHDQVMISSPNGSGEYVTHLTLPQIVFRR
ncbi:MAG: DUF3375 family protein [Anaerolineae bacterium]|nr:DUF3375 family protein [Anaerolineae bacterium]